VVLDTFATARMQDNTAIGLSVIDQFKVKWSWNVVLGALMLTRSTRTLNYDRVL